MGREAWGGYSLIIRYFFLVVTQCVDSHTQKAALEASVALLWPYNTPPGEGVLRLIFAGYVPLASQSPYPIIVYSVANYRPHLSHFWANM